MSEKNAYEAWAKKPRRAKGNAGAPARMNVPLCALAGIMAALFVKIFVADFYAVNGFSMEPAIKNGDVIAANKLSYGLQNPFRPELLFRWKNPKRGDVVLYMYQNYWVVKRCAAVGGTSLSFAEEDGNYFLLADGRKISLSSIQFHKLRTTERVPDGYILAVGDNEALSRDSRDYGFVPVKNVVARAIAAKRSP